VKLDSLQASAKCGDLTVKSRTWRGTIANILKRHGIEPAPERSRKTRWKEFLTRHWTSIVAADFFTAEISTRKGLQRFAVLFFLEFSTRKESKETQGDIGNST
jgi:hypothetical protein